LQHHEDHYLDDDNRFATGRLARGGRLHQLPDQQGRLGRRLDHDHLLGRLARPLRRIELHPAGEHIEGTWIDVYDGDSGKFLAGFARYAAPTRWWD